MALPSATLTLKEGQLAIPPETTDNIIAVLGFCTLGTVAQIYSFAGSTPADVVSTLGYGKLAQLVAHLMATPNHGPVLAVPIDKTAGVLTAVTAAGTSPPTVTLSGNSVDDIVGRVEILTAGTRGTATFRYCLDYDTTTGLGNWSNPIVTAATYGMDNSGVTLNFATGSYVADNVYSFSGVAPTHSDAQITAGMDALIAAGSDIGGIYVVSAPAGSLDSDRVTALATTFAAVNGKIDSIETAFRYVWCLIEAGSPVGTSAGGLTTWRTALAGATMQALTHKRMSIAAGYGRQVSVIDARAYRRSVGWRILERLSTSEISEHLGRVRSGPLATLLSIEHNEETTGGLANGTAGQRYLTLRTVAGENGFFVADTHTFASVGSDYAKLERLRVINRASKVGRNALLKYLNDTVILDASTGKILESEATHIDSDLNSQMVSSLINTASKTGKGHASSVAARVSRNDDLASSAPMTGEFSVQPLGYFRTIAWNIGFTKTNTPAAAG